MYDLKAIKAISIADVARKYGIELEKKHGRLWGKLRDEHTASFSINLSKNLWYDFGAGKGGSVIDLMVEIEGVSPTEAINKLAEEYGFNKEIVKGWSPLTDSQYRELGIEPERATMNFNYDLNKHTSEQLIRWNEKYGMSLKELAEKMPEIYNKLVIRVGKDFINSMRNAYFTKLKLAADISLDSKQRDLYKKWAEQDSIEINKKTDLLQRAIKSDSLFVNQLKVNPLNDFRHYELQKSKDSKVLREDKRIREKVVKVYKNTYNFQQADYLTVDAAKAISLLCYTVLNSDNKFLPVQEIKDLYKTLGSSLQKYESMLAQLIKGGEKIPKGDNPQYKEWLIKTDGLKKDISSLKDLFKKCSMTVEGLREASLLYNNAIRRQRVEEKPTKSTHSKTIDLTR